jgi:hydroxymethylbilane synthase
MLKLGTRGSKLALFQSRMVQSMLEAHQPNLVTELVIIKTQGEKMPFTPLEKLGGQGIFTRELDLALTEGRIDLAVHSCKDIPTEIREGVILAAVTEREGAEEAFISNRYGSFDSLPRGALIGTGSPRRKAQILSQRPDLKIVDLRGNVDTRLRKLDEGGMDATILACAGLMRLGLKARIREELPRDLFVPAPGQGALGVTARASDDETLSILEQANDKTSMAVVMAERAFLARLGGGCKTPIACHGFFENNKLVLLGFVSSSDGRITFRDQIAGPGRNGEALGISLADRMLKQGAGNILEEK